MIIAADLPVKAAIGLQKALISQRPVQKNLAIGSDLGRGDHRRQHIFQLIIEIAGDRVVENPVQRKAAAEQQDDNPSRSDPDHPATE